MDDVMDAIVAVNQNGMSPKEDVTIAAGWGRQTARVVIRNRVNPSPHILIDHIILAKHGLLLRR
jgi:hypothetical protein